MRAAELFLAYERPEGREPGQAEVLVRSDLAKITGGTPEVDYEHLTRMFLSDRLHFSRDRLPVTSLYFRSHSTPEFAKGLFDDSFRVGRALHVNAFDDREESDGQVSSELVMQRLIQRAAIYSRFKTGNLPGFTKKENVKLAGATAGAGITAGTFALSFPELAGAAGSVVGCLCGLAFSTERAAQVNELVKPAVDTLMREHSQDIVFPLTRQ